MKEEDIFLKGHWNRGRICLMDTRRKISSSLLGHPVSEDLKKKLSLYHLGKHWSEETRRNMKEKYEKNRLVSLNRICPICGMKFHVAVWNSSSKTCSRKCGNIMKRGRKAWNSGLTKDLDSRVKVLPFTEEHKKKIGLANSIARRDPSKYVNYGNSVGYFFSTKLNDNIPYRSSYELAYLKQLESDPLVVGYQYEAVRIPYFFEEQEHTTIPDFLVHYTDGHTELVEVKANWCLNNLDVQARLEAMKKYAEDHDWTFRLVTKDALVNSI